ncbi:phospholipase D/nuclease [Acephala macrosclerotiorum]|nr:phospholipase D/nuclease [Acephala macrosclerotiorum]
MDEGLERVLAAPRREHAELLEEEQQLQEAIRLSMLEIEIENEAFHTAAPPSIEDQPRERSTRMKRKAEEEMRIDGVKRPTSFPTSISSSSSGPSSLAVQPSSISSSKITMTYPNGGIRITRTPGRQTTKNCVNLKDLIDKQHLISACVFSFFIANEELFPYLPLSHSSNAVPIYIGRDANQDPTARIASSQAGITFKGKTKLSAKQLESISPNLCRLHSHRYGKNFHAFYAWCSGSSHSKILLLVYPDFLRLVITSCNMMDIDTLLGDNHWYIHDLPKLPSRAQHGLSPFEIDLLAHLQALGTPDAFVASVRGMYDYSTVKVHLVTSIPGVCSGVKAEKHGLLRLRRVVQDLNLRSTHNEIEGAETRSLVDTEAFGDDERDDDLDAPQSTIRPLFRSPPGKGTFDKDRQDSLCNKEELRLEVCTASIGDLSGKWLHGFHSCALGRKTIEVAGKGCDVPDLRLFYPTVGDVKGAYQSAQRGASNIGCHTRPWEMAPDVIKNLFHHYKSKDTGRLFHQKLIIAYSLRDTTAPPNYIYVGSANLSQSAWGALQQDKKGNETTCNVKLVKCTNFECGVVVPGHLIVGLLEPGTKS